MQGRLGDPALRGRHRRQKLRRRLYRSKFCVEMRVAPPYPLRRGARYRVCLANERGCVTVLGSAT